MTSFADILEETLGEVSGRMGSSFAAADGEMVECHSHEAGDEDEWAILTAHYGVIFSHIRDALGTLHYGESKSIHITNRQSHIFMRPVSDGYYALLAVEHPCLSLPKIRQGLDQAVSALREEMG